MLPSVESQSERYAKAAAADLATAAAAGAGFFGDGRTNGNGPTPPTCPTSPASWPAAIVGVLRERIERGFSEADDDLDELSERVRACYREWKTQRIGDTARHYVAGRVRPGPLRRAARRARGCAGSSTTAGRRAPTPRTTRSPAPSTKGEPFPTGHHYPPAHPGCRCLVVPAERQ